MHWLEIWMQRRQSPTDVFRGKTYYLKNLVTASVTERKEDGQKVIRATVQGSQPYQVKVALLPEKQRVLDWRCNCPRYEDIGFCKHIAAVMLKEAAPALPDTTPEKPRYADGSRLLREYLNRKTMLSDQKPVRLQPIINSIPSGYPKIEFQIGRDKLYVVKNTRELAKNVASGATVSYGKSLTFCHALENFDERSRELLKLLLNEYPSTRNSGTGNRGYDYRTTEELRFVRFTGMSFDRFFDLYLGTPIPWQGHRQTIAPERGNPEIEVSLKSADNGAILEVGLNGAAFFGSTHSLYAFQQGRLLRCTDDFAKEIYPLAEQRYPIFFDAENLPTLSSEILPKLQKLAKLEDPEGILERYAPEPCTPCFYFDWDTEKGLTAELRFRYADREMTSHNAQEIRRDLAAENRAAQFARRQLAEDAAFARLSDEDQALTFLTETVYKFQEAGEVYLSDRLKRKQLQPKRMSVAGVSVSEGLLTLELDTGEFPVEELDGLYESLLKKKKYHRLADGRFLALDGSGLETLAQAAHMLQLSGKELRKGSVSMPAFRALYLQELLGDRREVAFRRDAQYRTLIRAFKTVEDSDYPIPEAMEAVLRPYQATGFRWLKTLEHSGFGGLLADEMGLGKTVQMVAWFLTVPRTITGKTNLVVCPASLILNWGEELKRFAPGLKVALIMGNTRERKQQRLMGVDADVWVTSYDLLKRDVEDYAGGSFYACVLDEGQNIKNQSTQASKAVKGIQSQIRFVLTGTPIENRLSELWNLFDFMMPGYLFSHNAFVSKLEKPIVKSGNADAMGQLRRLVQPFILRRLKKDVLQELPEKMEYTRKIAFSEEEKKVYTAAAHNALQSAASGADKLRILALLTQLRQLCCDPNLCFENYEGHASKLEACLELCETMAENGHRILIFSQFTSMLERIGKRLDAMGISNQTLTGATTKEKRLQLVNAFQAGKVSVFMISLKAGGTGLNLTQADVVIHYDPWWNLSAQNQATDRAHRIGQKNCVQVYKLIAQGTVEEKILALQEKKATLNDVLSGDDLLEPLSREELLELMA